MFIDKRWPHSLNFKHVHRTMLSKTSCGEFQTMTLVPCMGNIVIPVVDYLITLQKNHRYIDNNKTLNTSNPWIK